jgi:hypothetical protein
MDNAGLFAGVQQTSPGLRPRLSQGMQQMVTEHTAGPIRYDEFKNFVLNAVAARQAAR